MKFKVDNKFIYLKNKKQYCFSLSATLYKINYTYSTLRNNKKSDTKYLLFFENTINPLDNKSSTSNIEKCFYSHIHEFNTRFHFRRLVDTQISSIELISKIDPYTIFDCDKGYIYLNIDYAYFNEKNFMINELAIHETICEVEINNKKRNSIYYTLSTDVSPSINSVSSIISKHSLNSLLYKKNKNNGTRLSLNLTKVLNAKILNTFKINTLTCD